MPQAVAVWATGFATFSAAAAAGAGYAAAYAAVYIAATVAITYALGTVSQALIGRPKGLAGLRSREMVVKAPIAARSIIYGEVTVGGVLVYMGTCSGDEGNNAYLDFAVVLAGHQCESITDVWFDDVLIPNADINSGNAAGGAVGGTGDYRVRGGTTVAFIYKYLGTGAQTASSLLNSGYAEWTTDHKLQGCTYVHIRLRRNSDAYPNGAPSNFRFRVKGAKLYDPRLDSTNGGSGAHRIADATTWAWSNNPALVAADYVAGGTIVNDTATPVRKRGFAVKTPATDIDWSAVIAAANICDEDVTIPPSSPATTQNRFDCDCVLVPSDDNPDSDCMDQILTSMMGQLVYTNGKYILYSGAYLSPVYTLTEADLAGPIRYVVGRGRSERYNFVRGTRYDLTSGTPTEFLSRTDSGYVSDDGQTLYRDIELPATQDEYRAQRIAQVILRRSREQQTLIWPGQLSAAKIAIWETVSVTVAELGISSKVFRCIGRTYRPGSDGSDPMVELTLREEYSATYTDPIVADYGTISVATDPGPVVFGIDPPTNLEITGVSGAIKFTITPDANASPDEVYEIFEYSSSTPFASSDLIWMGTATEVTLPKPDSTINYYWVRARRGAAVSTTYPATTGTAGNAGPIASISISADPEFSYVDNKYWPYLTNATYSSTGGLYGGYVRLSPDGSSDAYVRSSRYLPLLGTYEITITLRWKVSTSLTGSNKRMAVAIASAYKSYPNDTSVLGDVAYIDLSTASVGTWYTSTNTVTYVGSVYSGSGPFAEIVFWMDKSDVTGGAVDVDYAHAVITA